MATSKHLENASGDFAAFADSRNAFSQGPLVGSSAASLPSSSLFAPSTRPASATTTPLFCEPFDLSAKAASSSSNSRPIKNSSQSDRKSDIPVPHTRTMHQERPFVSTSLELPPHRPPPVFDFSKTPLHCFMNFPRSQPSQAESEKKGYPSFIPDLTSFPGAGKHQTNTNQQVFPCCKTKFSLV